MKSFFALSFPALLFFSCAKENSCDCFKGTGADDVRIIENPEPFQRIMVQSNLRVELFQSGEQRIEIHGGKKLLSSVSVESSNGTLNLVNRNRCNWVRDYGREITVKIYFERLEEIIQYGTGNITAPDTLQFEKIILNNWSSGDIRMKIRAGETHANIHVGVGDIELSGSSGVTYIYAAASGFIRTSSLSSGYIFLDNRGTGDCYVNVEKELGVDISHLGSVFYHGNPYLVNSNISGKGKLVRQE